MRSSDRAQRLAAIIDRERSALEVVGVRASARIATAVRTEVLRLLKRGQLDILGLVIAQNLAPMRTLVADAMTAGHLTGRLRAARTAASHMSRNRKTHSAYDEATAFLKRRMELTETDMQRLAGMYDKAALTVTTELGGALEERCREAASEIVSKGMHVREGIARMREAFDAAGMTIERPWSLETLVRTQTQLAYGAGQENANAAPEIQEILWGYEYATVGDDRVRPTHAAMDGVRAPKADPVWLIWTPPNGYNCRCSRIEVFAGDSLAVPKAPLEDVKPDDGFAFNPGRLYRDLLVAA